MRKTVDRTAIVTIANQQIAHLATDFTMTAWYKREAIIAVTSSILLLNDAYAGYRYLNGPNFVTDENGVGRVVYDETRVEFY